LNLHGVTLGRKSNLLETNRNPRVGMLAIVRKRRAIISDVNPFSGENGVLHLVRLDYKDEHRPRSEEVIWELEPARYLSGKDLAQKVEKDNSWFDAE